MLSQGGGTLGTARSVPAAGAGVGAGFQLRVLLSPAACCSSDLGSPSYGSEVSLTPVLLSGHKGMTWQETNRFPRRKRESDLYLLQEWKRYWGFWGRFFKALGLGEYKS